MASYMLFLVYLVFLINTDVCKGGSNCISYYNGCERNRCNNCQADLYDAPTFRNESYRDCGQPNRPFCEPNNGCNIYENCTPCGPFPSVCKPINTLNTTLSMEVLNNGPYYVHLDNRPGSENIDNMCISHVLIGGCTFVRLISTVYKDGSNEVQTFFASDYGKNVRGVLRLVGPKSPEKGYTSEMDADFLYAIVCANCSSSMYMVYRCQLYGECPPDYDYRFTLSTSRNISEECVDKALNALNAPGFTGNSFNRYPYNLPSDCKTSFLGIPVNNAGNLPPSDYSPII